MSSAILVVPAPLRHHVPVRTVFVELSPTQQRGSSALPHERRGVWPSGRSHALHTTEGQTQTLRRHVDDDGRNEEEAPDNATTDDEDDPADEKKQVKVTQLRMTRASPTPPTSNPTTPTANQRTTRLSTTTKTSTSTKKAATTQTATPASTKSQKTIQKTSWNRGSTALHNESNAGSGRLVSSKRNHVVDPQAEPDLLKTANDDCQIPQRPLGQAYLQLESNINQQTGYRKQGRPAKIWEDDLNIYSHGPLPVPTSISWIGVYGAGSSASSCGPSRLLICEHGCCVWSQT